MTAAEQAVSFESEGLRLEGLLQPGREGAGCGVVLHPHPLYGGDMYSPIVATLCSTLAARGLTTLRFSFRGAGGSAGSFSGGAGEAADALEAIAFARQQASGPLVLCGYSFGGNIAAGIATDAAPAAMVLVSPVLDAVERTSVAPKVPALLICGQQDESCDPDVLRTFATKQHRVVVEPGIDHFWGGGLGLLGDRVTSFLDEVMA